MFLKLGLIIIACLALMGQACDPAALQAQSDTRVRATLASWCPAIDIADNHYEAIRSRVSLRNQNKVDTVVGQFQMICAGRATATTTTVLTMAVFAGDAIADALKEARSNGADVGYTGYHIGKLEQMLTEVRRYK